MTTIVRTAAQAQKIIQSHEKFGIDFSEISAFLKDRITSTAKTARTGGIEVEVCGNEEPSDYWTPLDWESKDDGSLCSGYEDDWNCTCVEDGIIECDFEVDANDLEEEYRVRAVHLYACEEDPLDECWCHCTQADLHALPVEDSSHIPTDKCAWWAHGRNNTYGEELVNEITDNLHENHTHNYNCLSVDCSYECDGYERRATGEGLEYVSPILRKVWSNLNELTENLSNTSGRCGCAGVHVHVGAQDLTPRQISSLVWGWTMVGQGLVAEQMGRDNTQYARNWAWTDDDKGWFSRRDETAETFIYEFAQAMKMHKRLKIQTNLQYVTSLLRRVTTERYLTLNLQALYAHGTVEFRGMASIYNYDHLTAWASVCRGFVELARAGMNRSDWVLIHDAESYMDVLETKTGKRFA